MQFFRYKEDRISTTIFFLLLALDFIVYFNVNNIYILGIWYIIGIFPKACICSWNHHHQHLPTFKQTLLNRILEIVYALHTGITTNAWVLHHVLGHHVNYLDQSKDESGWKHPNGKTMSTFFYTINLAITGYYRAYQVGRKHPQYQKSFLSAGVFTLLLVVILTIFKPLNALFVFILQMLTGYIITCWHTYYHHAGLDSPDPYQASHNITEKFYNMCTGNLGYHTAHHIKPGLHWSALPKFHATIADKIPSHLYVRSCIPFRWFSKIK